MNYSEIGSEFWEVPTKKKNTNGFPPKVQWFLSGRSALQAIIKNIPDAKSVAMPSWCCDSMVKPFIEAGIEVRFFPVYIDDEDGLTQDIRCDCDVLYLMDYFGYSQKNVKKEIRNNPIVIRDVTHSVFSNTSEDADYYFGSLRKWCGVWTGGYAWTKNGHQLYKGEHDTSDYVFLRNKAMELKSRYINGFVDDESKRITEKTIFLNQFSSAEAMLDDCGISPAEERDVFQAEHLDIGFIKEQRRKNAKVLMRAFSKWLIFPNLLENDCPLFVPVLVPNGRRDDLRHFLIDNQIYCPVHWPVSVYYNNLTKKEKFIYENELSLVCDQRYIEAEMQRIIETIHTFWKER